MSKRILDLVLGVVVLLIAIPVLFLLAVLVKCTSPGPIFYRGVRVGRYGKTFRMWKFRSMVIDAEQRGGSSAGNDDPRITRIGKFMRSCKLDELPQLFNVLVGDMSFVGPRPQVQHDVDKYTTEEQAILTVRPGITDWASIWNSNEGEFLAGAVDPDQAYIDWIRPTKLRLQLDYVRNQTLLTDLKILGHTAMRLLLKSWTPREVRRYPPLMSSVPNVVSESNLQAAA